MCLLIKGTDIAPKTAQEPIRCLKVVTAKTKTTSDGVETRYFSFYGFGGTIEYVPGQTVDMNQNKSVPDDFMPKPYTNGFSDSWRVEAGIHTFMPDANGARGVYEWGMQEIDYEKRHDNFRFYQDESVAILECEIPAGARYFEGNATCFGKDYNVDERGYVSDLLHVVRALDEAEIEKLPFVFVPY